MSRRPTWAVAAFFSFVGGATGSVAQEPPPPTTDSVPIFTLAGTVVDAATQRPIIAAVVKFPELQRFTFSDVEGVFALEEFPEGTWDVVVEQLGYHTSDGSVSVVEGNGLHIRLRPDPVALAGFRVRSRSERLITDRRRRIPYRVTTISATEIGESASLDLARIFRQHANTPIVACGREGADGLMPGCYPRRGGLSMIRVYLDEGRLLGGMDELGMFPARHVHSMEWIPGMGMLRVYSNRFIERLDSSRISLEPLLYPD